MMRLELIIIGGFFFGMMYVSTRRTIVLFNKIFITNELRARKGAGYFLSILGLFGYLMIMGIALVFWILCLGISYFGEDNFSSGSGGILIIIFVSPIVWVLSEFFIEIGYIQKE